MNLTAVGSGYLGPILSSNADTNVLAGIVFDKYDKDRGGALGQAEIAQIMIEMYRSMNKQFTPTKADIDSFTRVLDVGKDGIVNTRDLERVCEKTMKVDQVWEARRASKLPPSNFLTQSMINDYNKQNNQ